MKLCNVLGKDMRRHEGGAAVSRDGDAAEVSAALASKEEGGRGNVLCLASEAGRVGARERVVPCGARHVCGERSFVSAWPHSSSFASQIREEESGLGLTAGKEARSERIDVYVARLELDAERACQMRGGGL